VRTERARAAAVLLVALAAALGSSGCREREDPRVAPGRILRAHGRPERALLALIPPQARAGEIFQRQPDGKAGLAVLGTGFTPGDVIRFGGRALTTMAANSRLLTASIPPDLLAREGEIEVTVANPGDPNVPVLRATFRLLASSPP